MSDVFAFSFMIGFLLMAIEGVFGVRFVYLGILAFIVVDLLVFGYVPFTGMSIANIALMFVGVGLGMIPGWGMKQAVMVDDTPLIQAYLLGYWSPLGGSIG